MDFLFVLFIFGGIIFFILLNEKLRKLKEAVEQLEWDTQRLSRRLDKIQSGKTDDLPDPAQQAEVLPLSARIETAIEDVPEKPSAPEQPELVIEAVPSVDPQGVSPRQETETPQAERPKSRTREEWESFIGGKLLNRIGALALIIGLGFFLKYAFDNNWLSETVRVLIGVLTGVLCLGTAHRTHKKGYQIFSQGLTGAGISILYLSVYASFNFYSLVPQWEAFIFMSVVTTLSLVMGISYDSLAIGLLGWAGGFLTPLMLSTGSANEAGLFTYIVLLDVGLLAVVLMKDSWKLIEPLTLASTWMMFIAWYIKEYREADLILTVFFILLFWLAFAGLDFIRLRWTDTAPSLVHHADAAAGAIFSYAYLYVLIDANHHAWMAAVTVVLAGAYAGIYRLLRRQIAGNDPVIMRYILTAVVLAVLATAIQFEDFRTVTGWALEAGVFIWLGVRWKRPFISYTAIGLAAGALIKMVCTAGAFAFTPIESFHVLLNDRCLALVMLAAAAAFSASVVRKLPTAASVLSNVFHLLWSVLVFWAVTVETCDFFEQKVTAAAPAIVPALYFQRSLMLACVWCLIASPILWLGIRRDVKPLVISSAAMFGLAAGAILIFGFHYVAIEQFESFFNMRTAAYVVVLGGWIVQYQLLKRGERNDVWYTRFIAPSIYGSIVIVFLWICAETNDSYRVLEMTAGSTAVQVYEYQKLMVLSIFWTLYSLPLFWFGVRRSIAPFVVSSLSIGFLAVLAILPGLSYLPIGQFIPLINIRTLAFILLLSGIIFEYRMACRPPGKILWLGMLPTILLYIASAVIVVWLTVEANDSFRHAAAVVPSREALLDYSKWIAFAVLWACLSFGFLWIAEGHSMRPFRLPGLLLMPFSIFFIVMCGIAFSPIESYTFLFNVRAAGGIAVFVVLFAQNTLARKNLSDAAWKQTLLQMWQIAMIAVSLVIVTGEARDYFQQQMLPGCNAGKSLQQITNLEQLSLSTVWILYSFILMFIGLWRSVRSMRVIAFFLFGITILKIFIYDLSYLETLYRIFSFIGLGVILLVVSYAYQRYKEKIFGKEPA